MRFFLMFLGVSVPLLCQAFLAAPEGVVRTDKTVLVESWDNLADVTVTETWENQTVADQSLSFLLPTATLQGAPQVFWNGAGQVTEPLDLAAAAKSAYRLASEEAQPAWLGATSEPFSAWWQVENLSLATGETATLKYEYRVKLEPAGAFQAGTVFLADGRASENLTVDLVRAGTPQHWFSPLGTWEEERGPEAWARRWQVSDIALHENLNFFTTDQAQASLGFNYGGEGYALDFKALDTVGPERLVVILDRSGSVYGVRWERLQQAFKTLLETAAPSTQIRVGLVGATFEWLDEDWEPNSRENHQRWLTTLSGTNVQGSSDWAVLSEGLESLEQTADNRYRLALLGDWSNLPGETRFALATPAWRVLMIDFWQDDSLILERWWQRFGGRYVRLFNSGYELAESELISAAWSQLAWRWGDDNRLEPTVESYPPKLLNTRGNQWSATQSPLLTESQTSAPFAPRWWAGRKLAEYLRQSLTSDLDADKLTAMASIADYFGLALPNVLASVEARWETLVGLESGASGAEARFWNAQPFYLIDEAWQAQNWAEAATGFERPALALWSDAHRALYQAYPQLLARPLSFGQTRFCAGRRCASVTADGRAEVEVTDRLLWETQADHWALEPWAKLVWAGVVQNPVQDYEQWAQPLSRGQFVAWLVGYIFPEAVLPRVDQTIFSDIQNDQVGAAESLWLAQQGLFRGYQDGTARLDQPLKRIEAVKLLMTAQGLGIRDVLGNFDAKTPLSDLVGWTQPWGFEAYNRGLIRGYEDKTFRPFKNVTEAEAFKLIVESEKLSE